MILQMSANAALGTTAGWVVIEHDAHPVADVNLTAFLVGANNKVRSDADMVFFNAPSGENGCATYYDPSNNGSKQTHRLGFDLSKLPAGITKIVVGLTEDKGSGFASMSGLKAQITTDAVVLELTPPVFTDQKSIVVAEIYLYNSEPKGKAVWQGYPGTLAALARDHGVVVDEEPATVVTPVTTPPTLTAAEVKMQKLLTPPPAGAPLVDLRKHKVAVILEKAGVSLSDKVDVDLVSDNSGSNSWQFSNGVMQRTVARLYPVACRLDPDESLASFVFGTRSHEAPPVDAKNYEDYFSEKGVRKVLSKTGIDNVEPLVMQDVIDLHRRKRSKLRTLCLFISDGGIGLTGRDYRGNVHEHIKQLVRDSDSEVFWAFVGVGGGKYGALRELDTLTGRKYDNSYFFAVDRIDDMTDEDLYNEILKEFAPWLLKLKADGVI